LSKLAWIAKLLVSIALVWWLLHSFSFAPVIDRMGGIRAVELIAILALAAAPFLMFGVRWWLVGKGCAEELPLPAAVRIAFISMFFNQTLPTTVSADIVRSYLASREGVPVQRAIVGVVLDRIIGSLALLGLVVATLPAFYAVVSNATLRGSLTAVALAGVLASGLLLLSGGRVAQLLKRWRVMRPVGILTEDLRGLLTRPSAIAIAALGIALHLASVGLVILLAAAMDIRLDPLAALVLVLPVILIIMIPVSIAGWGVREGALIVALAQAGVAAPDALAISIAFGLAGLAASLPGGVLWLHTGESLRNRDRPIARLSSPVRSASGQRGESAILAAHVFKDDS
jgi:hypothetical protein